MFSRRPARLAPIAIAFLVCAVFLLLAPLSFAQIPVGGGVPNWKDPNAILAWINMNAMLVGIVISLLWKYAPVVKEYSNKALPWLHLVNQVFFQLAGVATAAAAGVAIGAPHHNLAVRLGLAVANAAVSKYAWDYVLKPTLGDWLDWKLGRAPQTPHNAAPVLAPAPPAIATGTARRTA